MNKTLKKYISPIDIALAKFDKTHTLSASQTAEIEKYKRIYALRDHRRPLPVHPPENIWQDF
jgi:hypothetical protein